MADETRDQERREEQPVDRAALDAWEALADGFLEWLAAR